MSSLKHRVLSGLLCILMVLSVIPAIPFVNEVVNDTEVFAAEPTNKPSEVIVFAKGQGGDKIGLTQVVSGATGNYTTELWHYSGGYWGGTLSRKIYDNEFSKTAGGVANIEDTLGAGSMFYGVHEFVYNVQPGSELHKSIEKGDDIYIEIAPKSQNPDVTLESMFNFPQTYNNEGDAVFETNKKGSIIGYDSNNNKTDKISEIRKNSSGNYEIVFKLPLKLNYYTENELSFNRLLNKEGKTLGLSKWVPIPKLGYGYVKLSMFPRYKGGIQNNGNMASRLWFAPEDRAGIDLDLVKSNPFAYYNEMPSNYVHPAMIMRTGNPSSGNSGFLYDGYKIEMYAPGKTHLVDSSQYKIGINTLANAGAVGILFDYSLNLNIYAKSGIKVVATYAKMIGTDSNGVPLYEQIGPSEEPGYVEITDDGYISLPNEVGIYSETDGVYYKGILNDIVNSTKDLGDASKVLWGNNIAPQTYTDKVELNSNDILQYDFGRYSNAVRQIIRAANESGYASTYDAFTAWLVASGIKWEEELGIQLNKTGFNEEVILTTLSKLYDMNFERFIEMMNVNTNTEGEIVVPGAEDLHYTRVVEPADKLLGTGLEDRFKSNQYRSGNVLEENYTVSNKNAGEEYNQGYVEQTPQEESSVTSGNPTQQPANVIYIRYLLFPTSMQFNKINMYRDGTYVGTYVEQGQQLTYVEDFGHKGTVKFQNILEDLLRQSIGAGLVKWVTSDEVIENLANSPIPTGTKSGTTIPDKIEDVLKTEHVYAEWNMEIITPPGNTGSGDPTGGPTPDPTGVIITDVPEWRLSLYSPEFTRLGNGEWTKAYSWLNLNADSGCKASSSYITNSGSYKYYIYNPNGKEPTSSNTPENQKYDKWLHSKALTKGSYTFTHSSPMAVVSMSGTANFIKATDDSGLTAASWVESSSTQQGLLKYDIKSGKTPNSHSLSTSLYVKYDTLYYAIKNKYSYTHYKAYRKHTSCVNHGYHCRCGLKAESTTPNYLDAEYFLKANFDRYIQSSSRPALTVSSNVSNSNSYTTIKYQQDKTLNIYPEYGMLFVNDNNEESIKWIISDKTRLVKPVIYQTLDYKVYVDSASTGTMATDSRAKTKAGSLGLGNLPVLYKGAPVNSTFKVYRDSNLNKAGIMTVKTFALDLDTNKISYNDWGNNSYNGATLGEHNKLLSQIDTVGKATVTEKLLIDSPNYGSLDYTGGVRTSASNAYTKVDYSSQSNKVKDSSGKYTVCELKHKLIVRGGQVIGVEFQNRNTLGYTKYTMSQLKTADGALYDALVNMNLYNPSNDRSQTVLSTFEHKAGDSLTENTYATMLASARKSVDGIDTPDNAKVSTGSGWYSEDSTVLIVKEYITNYTVPSIAVSDKISLQVNGLQTPVDKNQFFNTMGKGYLYLKYDLPISTPAGNANAYFEFTTMPGDSLDDYGKQGVNYLVPNVSVSDTTRAN